MGRAILKALALLCLVRACDGFVVVRRPGVVAGPLLGPAAPSGERGLRAAARRPAGPGGSQGRRALPAGRQPLPAQRAVPRNEPAETGRIAVSGQGSPQRLANLVLVFGIVCFAANSIIMVDRELWRGWTWQEVLLRMPAANWFSYEAALRSNPVWTKTLINVIIYVIGDWMAQVFYADDAEGDVLNFEPWRCARNGAIALIFGPLVSLYYDWSDWVLPPVGTNIFKKIAMDQTLYLAVKSAAYIALTKILAGQDARTVAGEVRQRVPAVLTTAWRFWPAVHVITYTVVPPMHRVLWVNMVDLVWSGLLSQLGNGKIGDGAAEDPAGPAVAEER